ncbi:hypothetical protein AB6A40_009227 [Gnathostoma spinigerum]|uniref:Probable glycerol kinase n=1 Tax=Gnathostoma spinigerum TaxID=75299 RepID=A0ABD6ERR0_9BILA
MTLIGAIDQGTSSTRFVIFDAKTGNIVANNQIEIKTICPRPGWVEMDPNEIYTTTTECIENACKQLVKNGFKTVDIKAVGIANQRETTIIWDRNSGKPICNAIVWLDSRTSELAEEFGKKTPTGSKEYFKTKTGLPIHPYFSALKIRWLIDNNDAVRHSVSSGQAMFGNVDSWIIWKLTGAHVTDVTNASRTLLLDLHKVKWSTEMCTFFDIPIAIMPEIRSSSEFYGSIREGILKGVPITGCLGDQQASLIGHACMRMCETKVTYGTGTFMLCNIGQNIIISKKGLLTTIAFQVIF